VARFVHALGRLFSSFGLAVGLLVVLLALTFLGTMEQKHASIYDVQRKYFESAVVVHWLGPVPLPLPGAIVVLALLFVNLVVGGIVRIRKRSTTAGVIVAHVGILILLGGGFVEHLFSTKGNLVLYEGEVGDEYQSYFDWDVVVVEHLGDGGVREHVLPYERFGNLSPEQSARFTSEALPFDVRLSGFQRNCDVAPAPRGTGVDGFVLVAHEPHPSQAERNVPGLVVAATEKGPGGRTHRSLLFGLQRFPWRIRAGDPERTFDFDLRRRRWPIPFALKLEDVVAKFHPGTRDPSEYSSYVTKFEEGSARKLHITMNQPLRHRGYTFFQSEYKGREPLESGELLPELSGFSVVQNPADHVPIAAWVVIAVGLLWHMSLKFWRYIQAQRLRGAT
jgi:hypothetical protein